MSTRDLALATVEQALNRYLALDPDAPRRLARLHGRLVALHLRGIELTLYLVPDDAGRLQLLGQIEGAPDCTLSGSPLDLLRAGDSASGARQLFAGNLSIDGDTELGQEFGRILAGLDIDWEEQLSHLTGDVIAHQLGRVGRRTARYLGEGRDTLQDNLGEYLTEEARLLPSRAEAEGFYAAVDTLRDDTERLAARIARLQRRLAARHPGKDPA
jgi:ubiquinone biosynthesis protein UbiJ